MTADFVVPEMWCGVAGRRTFLPRVWFAEHVLGDSREYKQVTVLFADVVQSMDLAAAVGAERLREIMAELVRRAASVVQRYGGTIDKFTGDGIMALFGAPVALEDHAVRACVAALGIQDEAAELAVDVKARNGIDLSLRIGLNSGQVIAGELGSGPSDYTAIGAQVGMAQRMESAAPPGGIMVSESTARLVDARRGARRDRVGSHQGRRRTRACAAAVGVFGTSGRPADRNRRPFSGASGR